MTSDFDFIYAEVCIAFFATIWARHFGRLSTNSYLLLRKAYFFWAGLVICVILGFLFGGFFARVSAGFGILTFAMGFRAVRWKVNWIPCLWMVLPILFYIVKQVKLS